jgi:PAS domain S-box-containing protein
MEDRLRDNIDYRLSTRLEAARLERLAQRERSRERVREQLIVRLPLACITLDERHCVVDWNPAAEKIFGYNKAETLGRYCPGLLLAEPLSPKLREIVRRIESGDMEAHSVNANRTKAGDTIICEWFNTPVMDDEGMFAGVISLAQDVTGRLRADAALRRIESLLSESQAQAHIGNWSWDITTDQSTGSDEIYRIYDMVPDTTPVTLDGFLSRIHPDDRLMVSKTFERAFQDRKPFECMFRVIRQDGAERIVHSRARTVFDDSGKPVRMFGTTQDVTERIHDEVALQESRRRFQAIFENALDGIVLMDDSLRYLDANPAFCELLGYHRDEILERSVSDVSEQRSLERLPGLVDQFFTTGSLTDEYLVKRKDGTTREVEFRAVANILPGLHVSIVHDVTERKRAERQLKDHHYLMQAIIEGLPGAIHVKDREGRYILSNAECARAVGRTAQDMIGLDDRALFDSEAADRIRDVDQQVMETGRATTFELSATAGGGTRTYHNSKAPLRDDRGEVIGVLGMSRDITESKALSSERDLLLERLRLQIDRLPLAYILLDQTHHVVDWNPAAERIFGYTKEEVLGRLSIELIHRHPIDDELIQLTRRIEAGDLHADILCENVAKGGQVLTCQWFNTPLMDADGRFLGAISLAQDITGRVQADEESRILNMAMEHAVEGIARLDGPGRFISVNRAYADFLGYHPDELKGVNWRSIIHHDDINTMEAAHARMLSEGRAEAEARAVRKDGSVFWKHTVMYAARDRQGQAIGHYRFVKDITERKSAEEALQDAAQRLQELSRRVVEVQENERRHLAHELHDEVGQVLSAVSANLHAVRRICDLAAYPRIDESIQIVDQVTHQVRNLSLDLRPSMIDDLGLAATIRWFADRQARRTGFAVHLDVALSGNPFAPGVQIACFRVVQEALTNVSRHAQAKNVGIKLREDANEIELVIADDGIGFNQSLVRKRASRGESFGLLGIRERVELLGGRAEIRSEPGHGTTIRALFPIASPPEVAQTE